MSSSQELVQRATAGDRTAVEELLSRLWPGVQAYIRKNAQRAVLSRESSSDLVQSVCREALEGLDQGSFEYQGEKQFKQWLYQAAVLKLQNRARYYSAGKRNAAREEALDTDRSSLHAFLRTLCTPSQNAVAREELESLHAAFARLPERQRKIIVLARVESRSHREIAELFDITEENSRIQLSRALSRLASLARQQE
jgi:RNA polymerase sigma-70 factor (ECF subfamily)